MNNRSVFIIWIIILCHSIGFSTQGQERIDRSVTRQGSASASNQGRDRINTIHSKLSHSPGLEGSLELLNFCREQPEEIRKILTSAFNNFSVNPWVTFTDLADNSEFVTLCEKNNMVITGGPMLGNAAPDGIDIWVRTLYPASVEIRISNQGKSQVFGPVQSTGGTDLTAIVQVRGLIPETIYNYEVLVNGKTLIKNENTVFTTLPLPGSPGRTSIAFGSCFHRWGLCNQLLANQIKARRPMALLLNGDIAVQDRLNNIAMHRADYFLRDLHNAWKSLAASFPVYATWDDHDYFNNDLYNIPEGYTIEDKEAVCEVFRNSWNNPPYGLKEKGGGVFFRTRIGPADIIMLDGRYFREKGNFLGTEQMKWFEEQLLDCKGPFIIISNGTMWSDYVSDGKDSWGLYDPESREKIFSLIEKNHIGGVLLISGDRHGTRGFKIPRPSGFEFYEFECAGLGGRVGPDPINSEWKTQLFGLSGEYAFGEFTFNTTLQDPTVTFRLINERGTIYYELTLNRSQLTP